VFDIFEVSKKISKTEVRFTSSMMKITLLRKLHTKSKLHRHGCMQTFSCLEVTTEQASFPTCL